MATSQTSKVIHHLRRAVLLLDGAGLTDEQLLKDYLGRRDESALAALVRRHGPMVWGVCRRLLRNYHDAEDAFQATFLVLVRKAASIASPELLANWLYGVAHQTALKARATNAKREARERQVTVMPEPAVPEQNLWNDLQPLLDQALSRLPDKYRVAIVRCDLAGEAHKEVARQLGVPEGTLAARLTRGRKMLAVRLARHGLAVSGGSLAAVLAQETASAFVPAAVACSTIRAATLFAAGDPATASVISVRAVALTEGVLKTMFTTKVKIATALVLGVGLLGIGWGIIPTRAAAPAEGTPEVAPAPASRSGTPAEEVAKVAKGGPIEKKIALPMGPPPAQVVVSLAKDGKLKVKMANLIGLGPAPQLPAGQPQRTIESSYDLDEVQVLDAKGKKVGKKELAKALEDETVAVASFGGHPIDPLHLRILKEGTLVFILPMGGLPFPGGNQGIPPGFGPPTLAPLDAIPPDHECRGVIVRESPVISDR
jgi:RNA polymerase sigma factor (sigma-70 family)